MSKIQSCSSVLDTIGNTPLIELTHLTTPSMARVFGKAEHLNPTGSVKDRIAVHMLNKAEAAGVISEGATIIEATAGNTGLSFAMVAAVRGYRCIFAIPDKMSQEKIDMLKGFGAEVLVTPTALPNGHPDSWIEVAKRLAEEIPNSFYVNQFFNPDNPEAHYLSMGPEIWEQTGGNIDYFVAGGGTGGTVSGAGRYLKEQAAAVGREVTVICPDPMGSAWYDAFYKKDGGKKQSYKVEGIGNDFIPGTLDFSTIDEMRKVSDKQSFIVARRLAREAGLFIGGSGGSNLAVALDVAREAGPGKVVVTVLCDSGYRYLSKFFNDEWMKDLGYLDQGFGLVREILQIKGQKVEFASPEESIESLIARMADLGISQMPLSTKDGHQMVHENDLLRSLVSGAQKPGDSVLEVAQPLMGAVGPDDFISRLEGVFAENNVAVVLEDDEIIGVVSKIDLVRFLARKEQKGSAA